MLQRGITKHNSIRHPRGIALHFFRCDLLTAGFPPARVPPALDDRVGGSLAAPVLSHHRTYGSRIRRFLLSGEPVSFVSHMASREEFQSAAATLGATGSCSCH